MPRNSMTLTKQFLKKHRACADGYEWFLNQKETDVIKIIQKLIRYDHENWASWLIVRKITKKQNVAYAIYAAEQVINIYEEQYPTDKRPREAINAAKAYLKNPSKKNKGVVWSAAESAVESARSARSAAWSAARSAAWSAAESAVESARSAAESAESAAWSARSAESAAESARSAAGSAESAAYKKMQRKILNYGIQILSGE